MNNTALVGKKNICNFVGRSWGTVETWIIYEGFPAKKILGVWESDANLITAWRQKRLMEEVQENEKQKARRGNPNFVRKKPNNIRN